MSGNTFGKNFRVTTFGESHGPALGCVIDGCPAGLELDMDLLQEEMDRRRPGGTKLGTARNEADEVKIMSGLYRGKTLGTPIMMMVENLNQRSGDYSELEEVFRPGHADKGFHDKYGFRDPRGGGRSSGRETLARVAAGAVAKQILSKMGITVTAAVRSVKDIEITGPAATPVPPLYGRNTSKDEEILSLIEKTRADKDSLGGRVECTVRGVPSGLGEPVFDKADAMLAHAMLSIGSVKGIEFGRGFEATELLGSENNDEMDGSGYLTNNAGGILGGITNGEDIFFTLAVKPTPSIARPQKTVDINGKERIIEIKGRHDPTILIRILPVVEAMAAITVLDLILENGEMKKI